MTISRQGTRSDKHQQSPQQSPHQQGSMKSEKSVVAVVTSASLMDLTATGTPRRPLTAPSIPAAQDHVSPIRVKDVDARLGALEVRKTKTSPPPEVDSNVAVRAVVGDLPTSTTNVSHRPVSAKEREADGRPLDLIAPMAVLPVSHAPFTRAVTSSGGATPRRQ